jgi:uncharacterized membrane protein YkvA (DUF1232 family)
MFPEDPSTFALIVIAVVVVAMIVVAGYFLIRLLRSFKVVHSQLMPLGGKLAFWGALAYVVLPIDVLPDPLLIDDIALMAVALSYIGRLASEFGIGTATNNSSPASAADGGAIDPQTLDGPFIADPADDPLDDDPLNDDPLDDEPPSTTR